MAARWDGDDRGHGVADATQLVADANELVAAFREPMWVAEQPEVHLLPHIAAWVDQDHNLALTSAETDGAGAYVVNLRWRGVTGSVGGARAAIFALLGSFAEGATYVRQRRVASNAGSAPTLMFEVGTGEIDSDSRFLSHGHVVVINLSGVLGTDAGRNE
jgi:hypothetical protein